MKAYEIMTICIAAGGLILGVIDLLIIQMKDFVRLKIIHFRKITILNDDVIDSLTADENKNKELIKNLNEYEYYLRIINLSYFPIYIEEAGIFKKFKKGFSKLAGYSDKLKLNDEPFELQSRANIDFRLFFERDKDILQYNRMYVRTSCGKIKIKHLKRGKVKI